MGHLYKGVFKGVAPTPSPPPNLLDDSYLLFIYLFIYDCVESSFLCEGFL